MVEEAPKFVLTEKAKLNSLIVCMGGGCGNKHTNSANTGCNKFSVVMLAQ